MNTERNILHINVTDFMAAVEMVRDTALQKRPFVVGWRGHSRAVVLAVSEAAFQEGIRKGMPLSVAERRVRALQVISPAYDAYRRADERLAEVGRRFSPVVELRGGGHLYLDLAGTRRLFGSPPDCAERIRKEILESTALQPALGLGTAKVVSKVGTRVVRPSGFIAVPPGEERSFLAPLDVSLLPGVGMQIRNRLHLLHIRTMGDLSMLTDEQAAVLGPFGILLRNRAQGIDAGSVKERSARGKGGSLLAAAGGIEPTLGRSLPLPEDVNDPSTLWRYLRSVLGDLGFVLRQRGRTAGSLRLQITYTDGVQSQATHRFPLPLASDVDILKVGEQLLSRVLRRRVRVRALRCELGSLSPDVGQLELWSGPIPEKSRTAPTCQGQGLISTSFSLGGEGRYFPTKQLAYEERLKTLQGSLDHIRTRFGRQGILPCVELKTVCSFPS